MYPEKMEVYREYSHVHKKLHVALCLQESFIKGRKL